MQPKRFYLLLVVTLLVGVVAGCGNTTPFSAPSTSPKPMPLTGLAAASHDGLLGKLKAQPFGNSPRAPYFYFGGNYIGFMFRNSRGIKVNISLPFTKFMEVTKGSVSSPTVRIYYSQNKSVIFAGFTVNKTTDYSKFIRSGNVKSVVVWMDKTDFDRGVWSPAGPTRPR